MLRTLDRYVIREIIPPFLLSLLIFTFLLVLPPIMQHLENLLAKGVDWVTAARIVWTVVPQALGLTIPMALLVGLLIGLGRLSADRESVALLACGVSAYRLLRPVGVVAAAATGATLYVMLVAIPDANQTFREITFDVITKRVESDIHPRVFFEDFPGWVLYARDEPEPGTPGWKDLLVSDTTKPETTTIYMARRGRLDIDRAKREVKLVLTNSVKYQSLKPEEADVSRVPGDLILSLNPDAVFPNVNLQKGPNEKTIPELRADIQMKVQNRISPHPEIIALEQKFSIPVTCVVFALIGLALGLTVAREGKLAGFVVGIAVIFAYYILMQLAESVTKGYYADRAAVEKGGLYLAAHLARWVPDIVFGLFGIAALIWRARYTEGRLPFRIPLRLTYFLSRWRKEDPPPGTASHTSSSGNTPARRQRPVVVVRFPRIWLPGPGLLDRYIARIYGRVSMLSFLALLGLFYISTFIDRSDKMLKGQATTGDVLMLLFYQTPQYIYYVIPIATLLSVLVTFGLLSRSSELTVMKACGVSLYRSAVAVVLLSLVFSGILFSLEQQLLAHANRRAEALDAKIRGRPPRLYDTLNRRWVVGKEGEIYHYTYFDPERDEMRGLVVYRPHTASWTLESTTYAERAAYKDGWRSVSGWTRNFRAQPPTWTPLLDQPLGALEPPDYFKTEQPLAEMMTVPQLQRYVQELAASGVNVVPLAVDLQKKLAFPFVTFVMTLLAVPFGVSTGRRGTLYGIGLGITIALSYWIVISAFVAIGKGGLLQPILAGWAPNILVVGIASYLFLRVRT
jgi:LPS export ABC transporter permease LptG